MYVFVILTLYPDDEFIYLYIFLFFIENFGR